MFLFQATKRSSSSSIDNNAVTAKFRKLSYSSEVGSLTGELDIKNESYNRVDTSLSLLTKRFVDMLSESGVVDLNQCSKTLQVQKRRLYDITNVLEVFFYSIFN